MREPRDPAYYRAVARAVGVPEFWLEDATQDIALAAWKDGKTDDVLAIRREAIDAARRYGAFTRWGKRRPMLVPLDAAGSHGTSFHDVLDTLHSVRAAFGCLTPKERRALRRRLAELPMSNVDSARAAAARRKLRKQLAG